MDFLDPKKKRAHNIRLFLGYILVGVALLISTLILVFEASGFDIDRKTGAIIQNGLIFIDAQPEAADIFLNGEPKNHTDNRLVMPAGEYSLELKRSGYRTWSHRFTLDGGSIERFIYPFLFPEKFQSKDIQPYSSQPGLNTESPDRKWLLVQQPGQLTKFDQFALDNDNDKISSFEIPAAVLPTKPGTNLLELVEWSTDNRHVLIKHTFDGGNEFIMVDRDTPANSINVNQQFPDQIFNDIRLRDKKFDQYYIYTKEGGVLKTADLKSKLVTPLLTQVLSFQPHGDDMVLYATDASAPAGKVAVRLRSGLDTYTVRDLPVASTYLLDLARFDGHWYFAIGGNADNKVYIYKDAPEDLKSTNKTSPLLLLQVANPQYVSFSANARIIAVQGGASFAVYDAETNRVHRYNTALPGVEGQKANWMDGHRLTFVSNGHLVVFDFDNNNKQTLVEQNLGTFPFFNRDYTALYTISPSLAAKDKPALVRSELKINK
jgi:hypothetical protein